jgi:hypothetical protein
MIVYLLSSIGFCVFSRPSCCSCLPMALITYLTLDNCSYIPNDHRAAVMTLYRVPVYVAVLIILIRVRLLKHIFALNL